jgi:hypothetical protein
VAAGHPVYRQVPKVDRDRVHGDGAGRIVSDANRSAVVRAARDGLTAFKSGARGPGPRRWEVGGIGMEAVRVAAKTPRLRRKPA